MKSRWVVLSALIVMVGLAFAGAATPDPATPASISATDQAAVATLQAAPPADPYTAASPISTVGPAERASCKIFAQDCLFDGGPCGPPGTNCHCLFSETSGWRCGGGR